MNTLEVYTTVNPYGKSDECAKLDIYETNEWFVLSDIAEIGRGYTFSAWIKSNSNGGLTVGESYHSTTTEWVRYKSTFIADDVDLNLIFGIPGTYYIYKPKLEAGTIATDWSPAPEDLDPTDALAETNSQIQRIYGNVAEFGIKADGIQMSVSKIEKSIGDLTDDVSTVKSTIADIKLESDNFTVAIKKLTDDGSNKVTTTSGVFDDIGLTIDNTYSPTQTQITPNGMTVYKKDADGDKEKVLEAVGNGVNATNLRAETYLIVGGRSRFENYGTDRTGCFWVGGS